MPRAAERLAEPRNAVAGRRRARHRVAAVIDAVSTSARHRLRARAGPARPGPPVVHAGARPVPRPRGRGQSQRRWSTSASPGSDARRAHRDVLVPQLKALRRAQVRCSGCSPPTSASNAGSTTRRRPARASRADPDHEPRRWLDGLLASLADDLRYDAETARRVDARLRALVEDPHLQSCCTPSSVDLVASVRTSLDELDGGLQVRLTGLVQDVARRVRHRPGPAAADRRAAVRRASATPSSTTADAVVVLISAHRRGLGPARRLRADRGGRRARPAVHPHQRHGRRRPGRPADPRRRRRAGLSGVRSPRSRARGPSRPRSRGR